MTRPNKKMESWFVSRGVTDQSLIDFHRVVNGGYVFNDALHIFAVEAPSRFDNIDLRNSWFDHIYADCSSRFCWFAEDTFGNLFGYDEDDVVMFDLETGEVEKIATDFSAWLKLIEAKPNYYTGLTVREEWSARFGDIPKGNLLVPVIPLVAGGSYSADNFRSGPWEQVTEYVHSIYLQVKDLPDETRIEIRRGRKS